MKIKKVTINNRRKSLVIHTARNSYDFPFARLELRPSAKDPIVEAGPDPETGNEAFTYRLASGREDTIPLDAVLYYHRDPNLMRELLLYKMTLEAQKRLKQSRVSKREIIRRMETSPTQFYRLIDQTFYGKSIDQMVRLLTVLDCPVTVLFSDAA